MKKFLTFLAAGTLSLAFCMAACGEPAGNGGTENGGSNGPVATALGLPKETTPLSYKESAGIDPTFRTAAKEFAASFAAEAVKGQTGNAVVSPISVYLALGLAAECTAGETHEELMNTLKIDDMSLKNGYSDFYRSIISEYTDDNGELSSRVDVTNSIWVDSNVPVKQSCIDALSNDYLCYSYAAEFMNDNRSANEAVRDFVKTQTHGLIDRDFELDSDTAFALINTLYLKEIWDACGNELSLTPQTYDFAEGDGTAKKCNLLRGNYTRGRMFEGETFTHFYAETDHGYRLKFIVPKDGHALDEVFTAENLALIDDISDYGGVDTENNIIYETRCLFPEFMAEYNDDIKSILYGFGVREFFAPSCDFTPLTEMISYCEKVQHVTKLEVDRRGIEGAAVTVMQVCGSAAPDDPPTYVFDDFVVDRAFGFVLTDPFGTVLFAGRVNEI